MKNIFTSLQKKITHSTTTKHTATSSTSNSTKEIHNLDSSKQTTNEQLTGTPFRIVNVPEHGWFIALGMQRLSQKISQTRAEAIKPVQDRDWHFICNVIVTLIAQIEELNKQTN